MRLYRVVQVSDGWVLSDNQTPYKLWREFGVFKTKAEAEEVARDNENVQKNLGKFFRF
jgi:hypothetical protein